VTAIASASRSEVFWSFSSEEPLSVKEVASRLGKSAGSVNYHVLELVRVGLLIPVAERKRVARTEKLYVHVARGLFGQREPVSEEYRREGLRGFASILRIFVRERTALLHALAHAPQLNDFQMFAVHTVRLRPEDAVRLRSELAEVIRRYEGRDDTDGGKIRLCAMIVPEMGEIRAAYRVATGQDIGASSEPEDAAD
jgi:biotin operon repressor